MKKEQIPEFKKTDIIEVDIGGGRLLLYEPEINGVSLKGHREYWGDVHLMIEKIPLEKINKINVYEKKLEKKEESCLIDYYPDRILILDKYRDNNIVKNILEKYPNAERKIIDNQKIDQEIEINSNLGKMIEWGKKTLLLGETNKFLSPSEGQEGHYCKGPRKIIPISNGCHFSCEYCFMQGTYRGRYPRIKFNLNYNNLLKELEQDIEKRVKSKKGQYIYHMGENQDSLAFDNLYPLTKILVPFFAVKRAKLLLLSKSDCIENLLDLDHNKHTIVSWSINRDYVTRNIEHDTSPLEQRLIAAEKVQKADYPIRLRFDPLLILNTEEWSSGVWKEKYDEMLDSVFKKIKPERITMGSLRFHPAIKTIMKQRFPDSKLFNEELFSEKRDGDGRYRYKDKIRFEMYKHMVEGIRKRTEKIEIGLCKETKEMWESIGLKFNPEKPTCHCQN